MTEITTNVPLRLYVVEFSGKGGLIHYAYQLCTALADEGAAVTLVTTTDYEMAAFPHNFTVIPRLRLWTLFDDSGGRPVGRRLRRLWRGVKYIQEWLRLERFLRRERPDVIQFGKINFPFEVIFLARLRRAGLTLTQICHEFELRERGGLWAAVGNRLYAGVFQQFQTIFLHGESNRQRFLSLFHVPAGRLHTIAHGNEKLFLTAADGLSPADLRRRYGVAAGAPIVLFFGSLTASKGLPDLLEAFSLVRQQCQAHLLIAGYPTKHIDLGELKEQVTRLGLEEAVTFDARYIPTSEVGPLVSLANVVVYPYRNSSQSGSLQVAYACGRPVVATTVGGLPEAVEDGLSGYLAPPQNPPALAEAILRILLNPQQAAEMGRYARHLSETQFGWRPIARQILTVYREG